MWLSASSQLFLPNISSSTATSNISPSGPSDSFFPTTVAPHLTYTSLSNNRLCFPVIILVSAHIHVPLVFLSSLSRKCIIYADVLSLIFLIYQVYEPQRQANQLSHRLQDGICRTSRIPPRQADSQTVLYN